MTKYTEKYYAPIYGEEVAENLERLAVLNHDNRLIEDLNLTEIIVAVIKGEYLGDFTEYIKVKPRQYKEETLNKRYEKALEKLNKKYGRS